MFAIDFSKISTWNEAVGESFKAAYLQFATLAPNVLGMVVLLVVGYFVAKVLDRAVSALCHSLGLQKAAERGGLVGSMKQVGITRTLPEIVGRVVFWLMLCVFLSAGFKVLGLTAVSETVDALIAYVPKLFAAIAITVIGLLFATFIRGIVATSTDRVGITYAEYLANACYYILVLTTFLTAAKRLELDDFKLVEQMILIAFAAVAVGFGLAIGLGGKDTMAGILAGYYTRQRLQNGDRVTVGTMEGVVRDVGPTATTIETVEDGLITRHSVPNVKMINEAVR